MLPQVLIIDDVALNTVILRSMVEKLRPCETFCFTHAPLALDWCREQAPDLILLDYVMPEMDGPAFLAALREIDHCRTVPTLVITSDTDRSKLLLALEAGANDFLRKPVDPIEFRARVRNALELGTALTRLRHLATIDGLTGVLNRRSFMAKLGDELDRAMRYDESFAVALVDIDHFKRVNDRFGHAAGDAALIIVADTCRDVLRRSDSIGRLGGEEFGVLTPVTTLAGAWQAAERLRSGVAGCDLTHLAPELTLTISVGIALVDRGEAPEAVLARADAALYRAKAEGRDRVVEADPTLR
ncbi:MAG TPA: diguanylate cyclase [Sphingomonas sp.]|jgi:diguanylate cyclase (GGDEF)-like protein|uniref:diguanylate cyclase n=1 Tax=Sphingomonas sp. TaxID=28214 RepID=UPI002EDACF85